VNRLYALALLVLLPGCSTLPGPDLAATDPSAALRAQVTDWQLRGRVSLTRGDQGWHAGLDWENHPDSYRLQVAGPLGQGALRLTGSPLQVVLEDAEGRRYVAADAESLLLEVTGWELPVAGLRDWVRALPVPDVPATVQRSDDGRVARITQSGWTIDYLRFAAVEGMQWPVRMRMARDDLAVRLVIDQWQLAAPEAVQP
jgi:outer membrane lipoprotein LolB